MKKLLVLATLIVLVSQARGVEHLTINGEDVDSIDLIMGQSCTIEVVSDGVGMPYIRRLAPTNFSVSDLELLEIKPEAGTGASVTPGATYYTLQAETGMVAGVHFVFGYTATATGQKGVELRYIIGGNPIDSIVINVSSAPAGTAFTYQGQLSDGDSVANGEYDFEFKLYNYLAGGDQFGLTVNKEEVSVNQGNFTVELDFVNDSNVFNGDARWLAIGVRPGNDTGSFTPLSPRQELTPTPYALHTRGIYVSDDEKVGIGTTSPSAILDVGAGAIRGSQDDVVIGDTRGAGQRAGLELYTSTKSGAITYHPTEGMNLWVDGGGSWLSVVNVLPAGYVGIGTTSPQGGLHVSGNGGNGTALIERSGKILALNPNYGGNNQFAHISTVTGSDMGLKLDVNEQTAMTITTGGNVGIGTTNPIFQLEVLDDRAADGVAHFQNQNTTGHADGITIQIGPDENPTGGNMFIIFRDGSQSRVGSINGNYSGGINYNTTSDARLKTNIVDCNEGLDVVSRMKVRNYEMISAPGKKQIGFLAQELQQVYPQAVSGSPDSDVNEEPMMIDYGRLTPILAKAIQELQLQVDKSVGISQAQQKIIDEQNEKIDLLTEKMDALTQRLAALESR